MNGSNRLTDPFPLLHCNFQPLRGLFCFWVINFGLGAAQEERKRKQHSAGLFFADPAAVAGALRK